MKIMSDYMPTKFCHRTQELLPGATILRIKCLFNDQQLLNIIKAQTQP